MPASPRLRLVSSVACAAAVVGIAVVLFAAMPAWAVTVHDTKIAAPASPVSQVNVFTGSDAGAPDFGTGGGAGNTFPGAVLPFGMVQFSPDTLPGLTAFAGGYSYGDRRIKGFSVKHMSGPGCAAYQDLPFMPTTEPISGSPAKPGSADLADRFAAGFSHARERGTPGFYGVELHPRSGPAIDARLTATTRTAFGRFTYPRGRSSSILINATGGAMGAKDAQVRISPGRREISGAVTSGQFCYQGNLYRLYFSARFSRPFATYGTWRDASLARRSRSASDSIPGTPFILQPIPGGPQDRGVGTTAQTGAYATFDTRRSRTVGVRVGLSFVSVANARRNLAAESGRRRFADVQRRARSAWTSALGRIAVRGGSRASTRLFYTQLYRAMIHPSTFSDVDGRYVGFDGRVHDGGRHVRYADFSGWDTYRSQMPLIAMLAPRRASDMVRSLVGAARESGQLPKWSQANGHTHVMVGDPADPLIAGAYAFGARSFDAEAALATMVRGATRYGKASKPPDYYARQGLPQYLRLGYVPHELNTDAISQVAQPEQVWGSASTTLEYAVADFSIAQLAAATCDPGTQSAFMRRSANWRNLFDPQTRYIQPRLADGSFKRGLPAGEEGFVEGNAAQYTLFVPQDPAGLFAALGGRAAAIARLDDFFSRINAGPAQPYAFLGNEPTLGTPWLYNWLGQPYKAQRIVRRAMFGLYDLSPGGYPGNDDLGSMASWWVWNALGLYPATPGTDLLAVGTPLFPRATVRLRGGRLRMAAPGARRARPYVRGLRVGGRAYGRSWLRFRMVSDGAELRFEVGRKPNRRFGTGDLPPSYGPDDVSSCASKRAGP